MNMIKEVQNLKNKYLISVSHLFLFFIFPCISIWILGNAIISQNEELRINRAIKLLDEKAEQICNFIDPTAFFDKEFKKFAKSINWKTVNKFEIETLYEKFHGKELNFVPYVFKDGLLITPDYLLGDTGERIESVWLFNHGRKTKKDFEHKIDAQTLFGGGTSKFEKLLKSKRAIEFFGPKGNGLFFYNKPDQQGPLDGLFIISWDIPGPRILSKFIPEEMSVNLKVTIEDSGFEQKSIDGSELQNSKGNNSRVLTSRKKFGNRYLVFSKVYSGSKNGFSRTHLKVFVFLWFICWSFSSWNRSFNSKISGISLKYKLLILVLYAIILPISLFGYFGWRFILEHTEYLKQQALLACQNSIGELENDFEGEKFNVLNYLRGFKLNKTILTNPAAAIPFLSDLERKELVNSTEIRNLDGDLIVSTRNQNAIEKTEVINKLFAKKGIRRFISERLPLKQKNIPSASEVVLQEFLESSIGGWAHIFESPDELNKIFLGGINMVIFWDTYSDPNHTPAFILFNVAFKDMVKNFLKKNLPKPSTAGNVVLRRLAWSIEDSTLIASEEKFPTGDLKNFINKVRRNNSLQGGQIFWQGQSWLAAGAPGKFLPDNIIVSLYPQSVIKEKIDRIINDLFLGAILTVLLAITLVKLLEEIVISPISQLLLGINAIRNREVSYKIEVSQKDEFGKLSENFNQTMEVLSDVLDAQKIQAQIIPQKAPDINGLNADICSFSAADLGGDYCDIQEINPQKWIFLIGTVNGHGLSSSLITAMAKAIVAQSIQEDDFSMSTTFSCLDELLCSQFHQKKCMTLCAVSIDLEKGNFDLCNAAHLVPLFFSQDKYSPLPEMKNRSLGNSEKPEKFNSKTFNFSDGDCLIFYTDICVKLCNENRDALGGRGFPEICRQYLHLPPVEMRKAIMGTITNLSKEKLDEDFSLIIVKKEAKSEPESDSK